MRREFHPSDLPHRPGVYVFRDRFDRVIYIGKASDLRRRVSSYFQPSRVARADAKLRSLIHSIDDWSFQTVRNESEALILESRLIKEYAPHYNVLMRDDKRYPLLKIDLRERFPTLKLARIRKDDHACYFGPFPHGGALRDTLDFLLTHFRLRTCRDSFPTEETRRRCLKRIIRDCSAPCTGAVSEAEYRRLTDRVMQVLSGDIGELSGAIREKMLGASADGDFEKAARYRDVLTNLETVFGGRNRSFERPKLPSAPDGPEAVRSLQRTLGLSAYPVWMVCFDNSNLLGTFAVSSLVSFLDGRPDRANYRRFKVRTVTQADDFGTMKEIVARYFGRLLRERRGLPDLVVVDGGRGQLSAALDALIAVGCPPLPVIGLAKRNEEIFLPGRTEPLRIDRHEPSLRLLQAIRDESHRFAISYHRKLRQERLEQSLLDDIPDIGKQRKMQLLRAFGSVRAIRRVGADEIAERIPGFGKKLSQKVVDFLAK